MTREGSKFGLLMGLHYGDCSGKTFSKCQPVADPANGELVVVFMEWCGDCGAADYRVV